MFIEYNANPEHKRNSDCVVRALSKALGKTWEEIYIDLCIYGLKDHDWGNKNYVWGKYLQDNGYERSIIPNTYPSGYTVRDFAGEHFKGTYILALNGHAVAVKDGDWYDTFNSADEVVLYYWQKG